MQLKLYVYKINYSTVNTHALDYSEITCIISFIFVLQY